MNAAANTIIKFVQEKQKGFVTPGQTMFKIQQKGCTSRMQIESDFVLIQTVVYQFHEELKRYSSATLEKGLMKTLTSRIQKKKPRNDHTHNIETTLHYNAFGHLVVLNSKRGIRDFDSNALEGLLKQQSDIIDECLFVITLNAKREQAVVSQNAASS